MKARLLSVACVAASLMLIGASAGRAEFHIETIPTTPLFPGGTLELFFPEEFHPDMHKTLTFEGSIQNTSFTFPATIVFWFDWFDLSGGIATSPTQTFTLGLVGTGTNAQIFSESLGTALTYDIPFCPPEVSIHFQYLPPGDPGRPVFVTGTFTHECVPEPIALVFVPVMVLMAPLALRGIKKFAAAI